MTMCIGLAMRAWQGGLEPLFPRQNTVSQIKGVGWRLQRAPDLSARSCRDGRDSSFEVETLMPTGNLHSQPTHHLHKSTCSLILCSGVFSFDGRRFCPGRGYHDMLRYV